MLPLTSLAHTNDVTDHAKDGTPVAMHTLKGVIERRLLINYRIDPDVAAAAIPSPFQPALVGGYAIAGICLIQLRARPSWLPDFASFRSVNGAHRFAVTLPDGTDAVYVPRRDTSARLNTLAGGRLFPGHQHLASFTVDEIDGRLSLSLESGDGSTKVNVAVSPADDLPATSVFANLAHVSEFFEGGSLGYSDHPNGKCYEGIELQTQNWQVTPVEVEHVESSFFDDRSTFPAGSVVFDNALLMRDVHHRWQARQPMASNRALVSVHPRGAAVGGEVEGT